MRFRRHVLQNVLVIPVYSIHFLRFYMWDNIILYCKVFPAILASDVWTGDQSLTGISLTLSVVSNHIGSSWCNLYWHVTISSELQTFTGIEFGIMISQNLHHLNGRLFAFRPSSVDILINGVESIPVAHDGQRNVSSLIFSSAP